MDAVARVEQLLADAGLHDRVRRLDDSARTAVEAATALGCEVGAIASSLSAGSRRAATPPRCGRCSTPALASYDTVWASAGHPHAVFSATFEELRSLTGAPVVPVATD